MQVLVFGGAAVLLVLGPGETRGAIEAFGDALTSALGAPRSPPPAGEVTLESGQVVRGDVQVLSFDEVRASKGIEAALDLAIEKYPGRLRELLAEGVDPDLHIPFANGDGWSHPLEKAVRWGNRESVAILLESGADVNGAGSNGRTALHVASERGDLATLEELLRRGADPGRLAVPHAHAERAERTGESFEPPVGAAAIEAAARSGRREVVARLLAAGAEPRYALHAAAGSGSPELVALLLERGADPRQTTAYRDGPLRFAVSGGHLQIVRQLLAAGARPGTIALQDAARNGRDEMLRAFAAAGVRFDVPPAYWDPLFTAAHSGQASTVELLLELGASPAGADGQPRPIDAAREQGHADVVAILEGHEG